LNTKALEGADKSTIQSMLILLAEAELLTCVAICKCEKLAC